VTFSPLFEKGDKGEFQGRYFLAVSEDPHDVARLFH
jgi:hypothetical protein